MLAHARSEAEFVSEKAVVFGRSKAQSKSYICANSTCLAAEVSVRSASSYANVWLVTDEEINRSWLMMSPKPCCPHCGSSLISTENERAEVVLPLM